ncbi:MAG: T9SS type A sorting domain-containing protein [Flavipsychrobacter sp.]
MKHPLPILLLLLFVSICSFAQPGTLDSTYGVDGYFKDQIAKFGLSAHIYQLMPISGGGTIVLADTGSGDGGMVIRRYLKDGSRDNTFGIKGTASIAIDSNFDCFGAAMQADGKILATGFIFTDGLYKLICIRVQTNGTLDSTFGINGASIIKAPGNNIIFSGYDVAVKPDNKIVIGATAADSFDNAVACIIKLKPDGSYDSTFGVNGMCVLKTDSSLTSIQGLVQLRSGKMCVVGPSIHSNNFSVITANGQIDSSFGINGKASVDTLRLASLLEQADGKLLAFAYSTVTFTSYLKRFTANGIIDSTWGINGLAPVNEPLEALALLPNGNFIGAGVKSSNYFVSSYKPDLSYDSSFGTNGTTTVPLSLFNTRTTFSNFAGLAIDTNDHTITFAGLADEAEADFFKLKLEGYTGVPFVFSTLSYASLYPNPSHDVATLHFSLSKPDAPFITIYDVNGRAVQTILQQKTLATGSYNIPLNLGSLQAGIYFVRLANSDGEQVLRLAKE